MHELNGNVEVRITPRRWCMKWNQAADGWIGMEMTLWATQDAPPGVCGHYTGWGVHLSRPLVMRF